MPWTSNDAKRFTKKATTKTSSDQWSDVANKVLAKTGDDAKAVQIANGVVKNNPPKVVGKFNPKSPSKGSL